MAGGHRRFPRQHPGLDRSRGGPALPEAVSRGAGPGVAPGGSRRTDCGYDQLLAVASPRPDTLGIIVLVGPLSEVGEGAQVALEHGATVLAMELARLQSVADTELRLGRDLVEELLAHDDETAAISRARAMGYDLDPRHQVAVVVEHPPQPREPDVRFHAVRRAALAVNVGTLLVPRGDAVVVLGRDRPDWAAFHRQLLSELGPRACVGVGGPCDDLAGFPRSFHQARLALRIRDAGARRPVLLYEQLGSYRLLAEISDLGAIDRFVDEWLSPLIAHDQRHRADLVRTLVSYVECRGSYDATAASLHIHRNTLKYRLRRIIEVSGRDLKDGDTLSSPAGRPGVVDQTGRGKSGVARHRTPLEWLRKRWEARVTVRPLFEGWGDTRRSGAG